MTITRGEYMRTRGADVNPNGDRAEMLVTCSECPERFPLRGKGGNQRKTCSKECKRVRVNRLDRERREMARAMREANPVRVPTRAEAEAEAEPSPEPAGAPVGVGLVGLVDQLSAAVAERAVLEDRIRTLALEVAEAV